MPFVSCSTTLTRPRRAHVAALILLATAACVPIGRETEPEPAQLEPEFAPDSGSSDPTPGDQTTANSDEPTTDPSAGPTAGTTDAGGTEAVTPGESPGTSPTASPSPTTAAPFRGSATVTDAPSDRSATLEPSPDWADLETIRIQRDDATMTLAIGLSGGAPETAPNDTHTMNIATFFDVDGDGFIDYEIWANVNDSGWGTAYYDNVEGKAEFADQDDIEVEVVDAAVVMTFPANKLASAERFRFATASEYGRYETIGTDLMARDDAPDNDQPARFPG